MTTNGTTALAKTTGQEATRAGGTDATHAFEPQSLEEGYRMAKLLVASRLLPRGIQTPEAALTVIATGRELGLTALQSVRSIHIIEGKPTLSADLMVALVKRSADCVFFRLAESTDKRATYETQRKGEPKPTTMSFTIEDAQRAGVAGKDNWKKYPAAMLRARCSAALARAVYPDLAMGLYDPDELSTDRAPQRIEVETVPAPDDEPQAVDTSGLVDELRRGIAEARSMKDLRTAGASVKGAFDANQISDVDRLSLANDYEARVKDFAKPAAPAPASVDYPYAPRDEEEPQ